MLRYNDRFMQKTFAAACDCEKTHTVRICATLVYKNTIICTKSNIKKSHPFQKRHSTNDEAIFLHAENNAIVSVLRMGFDIEKLRYCQLYVARAALFDKKNFSQADVKPCEGCQSSIALYRIRDVFYTTNNGVECL